jgi:hypothetical protein
MLVPKKQKKEIEMHWKKRKVYWKVIMTANLRKM